MNDSAIRTILKTTLSARYKDDPHTKIVEELGLQHGASRIDLAVINGVLHGYEIKSDEDTLGRLPHQMSSYNSIFDHVTLVVGYRYAYDAIKTIPEWWGVLAAELNTDGVVQLFNLREGTPNSNQEIDAILELLWKEEAIAILDEYAIAAGVKSKPKKEIYQRITEVLEKDTIKDLVRCALRTRVNWRVDPPQK